VSASCLVSELTVNELVCQRDVCEAVKYLLKTLSERSRLVTPIWCDLFGLAFFLMLIYRELNFDTDCLCDQLFIHKLAVKRRLNILCASHAVANYSYL